MTPARLREIIAGGETIAVEFKGEEKQALSDADLVEAVVCLANRPHDQPACLLVGVEDDGRITGARPRHGTATEPLRIQALVANRTRPPVTVEVEAMAVDGHSVLVLAIAFARTPVGTADGHHVRRTLDGRGKPACVPYHFHEMQIRQADRGLLDYAALVVPEAGWADLDPLEFERFRRTIREGQGRGDASLVELPDVDLAKALGSVEANHEVRAVRVLGLLLFGREAVLQRLLPTHEVAFQVLSGVEVQVNDFLRWPLVRTMDEMMTRFRARYRERELMVGMVRVGVPDYSEPAFREGLANALIHRDYARLGAVHVQWHADRIEISSPGGFPEGVTLDNLLVTPPRPRSPLLADAFKRAGLVERNARGIDMIFYEQLRNGRRAPSYARSTDSDVVLELPGGEASLDLVRLVVEEIRAGRPLGLDELALIRRLWMEGPATAGAAAEVLQKSGRDAEATLQKLVVAKLVEERRVRQGRSYGLSPKTSRRLAQGPSDLRVLGVEPAQRERMVVHHAGAHGRITRREVAELCGLGSYQASRLLQRVATEGKLDRHGSKRGVWYSLPAKRARSRDMSALKTGPRPGGSKTATKVPSRRRSKPGAKRS